MKDWLIRLGALLLSFVAGALAIWRRGYERAPRPEVDVEAESESAWKAHQDRVERVQKRGGPTRADFEEIMKEIRK